MNEFHQLIQIKWNEIHTVIINDSWSGKKHSMGQGGRVSWKGGLAGRGGGVGGQAGTEQKDKVRLSLSCSL
jgi:hypothetical protein